MLTEKIWACEENFILDYYGKIINATNDQIQFAIDNFNDDLPDILSFNVNENGKEATIKIEGVLSQKGPTRIDKLFGYEGTSYFNIIDAIESVKQMDQVDTVRLLMNTPGGEVVGVDEVWESVFDLAKSKKVIAENHGFLASAGYWIASAAKKIIANSPVAQTGSIGVVVTQLDTRGLEKRIGIKRLDIKSKNAPNKNADLTTQKGRSNLQDRVDAIERVFISRITKGRKLDDSYIIDNFGKGSLLIARDPNPNKTDALSVKMIDDIKGITIPKEVKPVSNAVSTNADTLAGATTFKDFPIIDKSWDSDSAIKRIRKVTESDKKPSANYKDAFFWYDSKNDKDFGAYKLPFVDVVKGKMSAIRRGINAANAAMAGARGGVKIPSADRGAVQAHIDKYRAKIEKADKKEKGGNEKMSTLKELLLDNPELSEEIEGIKQKAFDSGKESIEKKVKVAVPILQSGDYPATVKELACGVLTGEKETASLEGAITVFDALKEKENTENAQGETEGTGETPPQVPETLSEDGIIRNEADYEAAIKAVREGR